MNGIDRGVAVRLPFEIVAASLGQAVDAASSEAVVQRQSRQLRDCRLWTVTTVVERQRRLPAEVENHFPQGSRRPVRDAGAGCAGPVGGLLEQWPGCRPNRFRWPTRM